MLQVFQLGKELMKQEFTHVALSVPREIFDHQFIENVLSFYGVVFEVTSLIDPTNLCARIYPKKPNIFRSICGGWAKVVKHFVCHFF